MFHSYMISEILKFAMLIGHAHGAGMIPLSKEKFHRHTPVFLETVRVGAYFLIGGDGRCAGRKQFGTSFDLNKAQTARPDRAQSVKIT